MSTNSVAITPIETEYKGYRFRSRLEARWAVFLDACGADWEYEPEGFDLGDGLYYLPDFRIRGCDGRCPDEIYAEVKGKMSLKDVRKIEKFAFSMVGSGIESRPAFIVVLGNIPCGEDIYEICDDISDTHNQTLDYGIPMFGYEAICGDLYPAIPCVTKGGKFGLQGPDYTHLMDEEATLAAYSAARKARFEHGETPYTEWEEAPNDPEEIKVALLLMRHRFYRGGTKQDNPEDNPAYRHFVEHIRRVRKEVREGTYKPPEPKPLPVETSDDDVDDIF